MSYNVFVYERFKKNLYIKYKGAKDMGDVEKKQQLIEEHAYNQCSIIIRVDGEETEIPINFGMTADEIKAKGFDAETVDFVLKLVKRVEYKRFQAPPILKVSCCPFGHSQSVPLVARY